MTKPHRRGLLILFQRALNISVIPSKRHKSSEEVKGRPHSSERPPDVTCTGAQVCLSQSDTHTTTKGYHRELAKHSFTCWFRFLASRLNHTTRISSHNLALINRRGSTGPGSAKNSFNSTHCMASYLIMPHYTPTFCSYLTFPSSSCLISFSFCI